MQKLATTFMFILMIFSSYGQVLEFDQLEMRYDQRQYKTVYKRANKLLANPAYDFSYIPSYYLALSKFQLAQNSKWLKRNKYALEEATNTFRELQSTREGREVLTAHQYEISVLKNDLLLWMYKLNEEGDKITFNQVDKIVKDLLSDIPDIDRLNQEQQEETPTIPTVQPESIKEGKSDKIRVENLTTREEIIKVSEGLLGVPYKWAGVTPSGFDCSGFTGYVIRKTLKTNMSHRASDQYKEVKKIKRKDVQQGDLVFFSNGGGINHVGIIYSLDNESIQMIHSSSSIGISIVDIYESDYWRKRIAGFGKIVDD